jgi:hypothetical protein
MNDYLSRVLVYLKQELPSHFKNILELDGWVFKFRLPDNVNFNEEFNAIKLITENCMAVIRERKAVLNFTV